MKVIETRCDRCESVIKLGAEWRKVTLDFHPPVVLDLCKTCESDFERWVGKHLVNGRMV